MSKPKYRILC